MRLAVVRRASGWLTELTGTGVGASVVLALLVMASVFAAIAAPRASLADRTTALHRVFAAIPAAGRSVVASANYLSVASVLGSAGPISPEISGSELARIGATMARHLLSAGVPLGSAGTRWSGMTTGDMTQTAYPPSVRATGPPRVHVLLRPALGRFSQLTAGRMPARSSLRLGSQKSTVKSASFEVAVTTATAARFSLSPGSVIHLGRSLRLTVTGIIRPLAAASSFWAQDPSAARAAFISDDHGHGYWQGAAFVATSEVAHLQTALDVSTMSLTWDFPLRLDAVAADQAAALAGSLTGGLAKAGLITVGLSTGLYDRPAVSAEIVCGVIAPLDRFLQAEGQFESLLSLLQVSLAIVGAVVLLLGSQLLAERRAPELAVMRARGAALSQLAALAFRAGLVVVLPAAGFALLVAVALTPGGGAPLAWWLAGLTTIVALAAVPWLAIRCATAPRASGDRADRAPSRVQRSRRIVADLCLCVAAIGGLVILRNQGLAAGGPNWYPSAAPALVAVPVAIGVMRGYPYLVRGMVRLAGRRPGVTAFVGLARAARTSASAILPAFALVLVLAVTGFGAMLRVAITTGDAVASWHAIGADVVVDGTQSTEPLGARTAGALRAVPGARRTCALSVLAGAAGDGTSVSVVVMNPARYAALIAGTPLASFPAGKLAAKASGARMPVLASALAAADLRRSGSVVVAGQVVPVRVAGVVASPASRATGDLFVVIGDRALPASARPPNLLLMVGSGIAAGPVRSIVRTDSPAATVTMRSAVLASLLGAALPHSAYVTFAQGAVIAAVFGAIILAIMLALGARPRELTLARLFTMGLSAGQARWLVIAEVLPWIAAAGLGGAVAVAALGPLLAPAVDLSQFTGSTASVPLRADLGVLAYLTAGLLGLSLATLFAQSAMTRLRGIARALRVGE